MKHFRSIQKAALLISLGCLLASCNAFKPAPTSTPTLTSTSTITPSPTPTITPSPTPVFPLPEGKIIFDIDQTRKFAGTVTGQGETAIILANMSQGGEAEWDPFVSAVDKQKFTVVTFGYLQPDLAGATQEIGIVLKQLRKSGYKRVICIGASLGVTACGSIANQPEMIGLVMISGPYNGGSLGKLTYPKLFIAAELDPYATDTRWEYHLAGDPKTLKLFPNNSYHGTNLFYSSDKVEFLKLLIDFVNNLR